MMRLALIVLPAVVFAARNAKHIKHAVHVDAVESIPMYMYKQDCGLKRPIALTELSQKVYKKNNATNPGAGLGNIEPFATVLKDGFFDVGCVKDYMFEHGDKNGANRHIYEIGASANVSIVHYKDVVPKEDQEGMTHQVCFEFCRTVPDMGFFALTAGRECYCEPYFKQMAGDSSQCDAVCEGKPTTMCGGMAKSSVFEMHLCADTAEDLAGALTKAGELKEELTKAKSTGEDGSGMMQSMGANMQDMFGAAGDPTASNLMQSAKVFAGEWQHASEDAAKIAEKIEALEADGKGMEGGDFTDVETITKAEATVSELEASTAEGAAALESLVEMNELGSAGDGDSEEGGKDGAADDETASPLKQYMPVMYFVDREFEKVPSTCGGDVINKPYLGTADECALACDAEGLACAGFSFFTQKTSMCFLFGKFTEVTYYTGCEGSDEEGSKFMQISHTSSKKKKDSADVMCYAKFASFTGMTLKPDASGKCKQCLKTANKAQRCYN